MASHDEEMSMGEEMMNDLLIEDLIRQDEDERNFQNDEWIGIDGTRFRLEKMTSSHIRNCIRMLDRNIKEGAYDDHGIAGRYGAECLAYQWIDKFNDELLRRYPPFDPAFANW